MKQAISGAFLIALAMLNTLAYAKYHVIYDPPDPNFEYTYCYPQSQPLAHHAYQHHATSRHPHKKHNRTHYSLSVYYLLPHSACSSCIKWVPSRCTCYGECVPGHWETFNYLTPCAQHPQSGIDDEQETPSYDTITSDDVSD